MMRNKLWVVLVALSAPLLLAGTAWAGNPPQSAYGGSASTVVNSVQTTQQTATQTLPFTGISVWQILAVAAVLLVAGVLLRRGLAGSRA